MKRPLKVPVKKTVTELPVTQEIVTQKTPLVNTITSTQNFSAYTSQTGNFNQTNSDYLIEEINSLKKNMIEKDLFIAKLIKDNQDLTSKFNVSEISKSSLINELTGLKEDKADLRADKARLHEEIALLRKSELINQENILQKTLELEQLNKIFNESSIANNSFIQEEKKEPIINNLEIPLLHISNSLIPNETVESIYLSDDDILHPNEIQIEKIELSGDELNSFSIID